MLSLAAWAGSGCADRQRSGADVICPLFAIAKMRRASRLVLFTWLTGLANAAGSGGIGVLVSPAA